MQSWRSKIMQTGTMAELRWVLLHVLFAACISLPLAVTSGDTAKQNDTASQPAEMAAQIGQPVTLSCQFSHTKKLNAETFGQFYKTKPGSTVTGNVTLKCRPHITQETMSLCELTQKINQTSLDDEGMYYCEIIIISAEEKKTFTGPGTKLSLYAAPSVEIFHPPLLLSGHHVELTCNASGFYPQNVSVFWLHRGLPPPASMIHTKIQRDSTGTYSLQSQYGFDLVQEDHNTECLCQVSHPDWTVKNSSAIILNVNYGPTSVSVTSSAPESNGSVWAEGGSSVTFVCAADGNPMPDIRWLWGNLSKSHGGDTLLIANVQKKDEGLYICVVCNQYGEENTSMHLQVSERTWTAHCPHSRAPISEESVTHQAIYAVPDKKRKRLQGHGEVLDESHLIYTEIMAPAPSRNVESANSMSLYSVIGAKRQNHPGVQQQHTEGVSSVYVLAESPMSDLWRQQEPASPFQTFSHY
ncbi:myelin-associated glycoprotein-like isoform X2 [Brienomyrus brachyistius]|uniref:myelin-associated glycoprotein-like isoform X2 n=1 Tax=Brienomyrus brachyistius TaxID=42636 RepID=UPI0020B27D2E|nr:myelin-associated glycoprotein-like isoform X2 [Brienomyrus brachyistius]